MLKHKHWLIFPEHQRQTKKFYNIDPRQDIHTETQSTKRLPMIRLGLSTINKGIFSFWFRKLNQNKKVSKTSNKLVIPED